MDFRCLVHDDDIDPEYKCKAVLFWKQGVKNCRKWSTVQHNFRLVSSERHLKRWAIQIETGGNKREALMLISEYVLNEFRSAVNTGRIVHDRDLRRWALKAYNDEGNKNILFKASRS